MGGDKNIKLDRRAHRSKCYPTDDKIISEAGVVRLREPLKFLWALTISLERLKLQIMYVKLCVQVGYIMS